MNKNTVHHGAYNLQGKANRSLEIGYHGVGSGGLLEEREEIFNLGESEKVSLRKWLGSRDMKNCGLLTKTHGSSYYCPQTFSLLSAPHLPLQKAPTRHGTSRASKLSSKPPTYPVRQTRRQFNGEIS